MLCLFFGCSDNPTKNNEDNTTHISAGVKGKLVDASNNPVSGAIVRLYPVDYVPSTTAMKIRAANLDTTDDEGVYEIPNVDTGTYNIEGQKDTLGVFIDSIDVPDDTSIIDVPPGQLKKLGKITGITHMPGQSDTNQVRVNIYVPGTRRITLPNIGGRFTFDLMPAGRYQIIINPTLPTYNVKILDTTLNAGETLDLDTIFIKVYEPDTIDILTTVVWGTWGPNKNYRIYTDIEVPLGKELTILPGTKVIFAQFYNIIVNGSLTCKGEDSNFIVFKHEFPQDTWNTFGITADTITLEYCVFENSKWGLSLHANRATIRKCIFRYGNRLIDGISGIKDSLLFYNNIIHNMTMDVNGNHNFQIFTRPPAYCIFANNVFLNNSVGMTGYWISSVLFRNNCFFNCQEPLMRCPDSTSSAEVQYSLDSASMTLYENPLFVNDSTGNEDYHLQFNSPCMSTGMNGTDMGIYSTYEP
ncbi:MAG: hypothetical protein A2268_06005 [Candidatus Raymondbacteria bacterium RifOxyA12_full_50_37]|uniref:Right handed beta helix domain-containing protein n=1 Tax=Candidatus Raymondbacteria bacterium RIFOXYD12_FULL_49_13 TaxID=1817890 RepID=A0A1F7FJZ9_UNCRA|nr:MAG: hypothetical protein A2268_06005 [Candidatus Raymondbacteria bacterium RifOxyA12_full_50_37]OGJ94522.1 MAG: hypothetical protein A2248_14935 [Candidatus Raymondbacteria bacterium RIFOXYA2_FULL_49_16]OGK02859.1 MAG: hypothetical protein A2350_19950 [Candidatus Raymondbacteria bacterium RifOxyB12_full_50_8]OGK07000.1 MAG: hypothetical protein A2519_13575 [Candidatus Raymondbacteria bacterium RIFOXYD12_FULL_49_13]OGP45471.1 MAG: hypothetical protein A2324_15015 [Candidatus Raymondbacteria 